MIKAVTKRNSRCGLGRTRASSGPALSMNVSIRDTDSFHGHLRNVYGFAHNQTVVLAQSMAAVIEREEIQRQGR